MPHLKFNTSLLLAATLLFLVPGLPFWGFDGIPLNTFSEYSVFLILALSWLNVFLGSAGKYAYDFSSLFKSRTITISFILVLCLVKTGSFYVSSQISSETFHVCYKELNKANANCLFSADNIFNLKNATYLQPNLLWRGNGTQEQWYLNEDYRSKAPGTISITYEGILDADLNTPLRILYQGNISGKIAEQTIEASSVILTTLEITQVSEAKKIPIYLTVVNAPTSHMEVQKKINNGWKTVSAASAEDASTLNLILKVLSVLISGVICVLAAYFLWNILFQINYNPTLLFLPVGILAVIYLPQSRIGLRIVLSSIFLLALYSKKRFPNTNPIQWIILLALCLGALHLSDFNLIIRQPGDDPLTYDTLARYILRYRSLQGGENIFFLQPGFRYYQSLMFAIFGENNLFPTYLNLLFLYATLWGFFTWLESKIHASLLTRAISVVCLLLMAGAGTDLVMANLSEFVSWVCLLLSIMLGFSMLPTLVSPLKNKQIVPKPLWYFILFPVLMAYAGIVRPNQIIGSITLFSVWLFLIIRINFTPRTFIAMAAFAFVALLPLMHNLYFGDAFVFLSTTSTYAPALTIPPKDLLKIFSSEHVQQVFFSQLRHLFAAGKLTIPLHLITRILFNLLFIGFFTAIILRLRHSDFFMILIALLFPLSYFLVHVFYDATCYYPRHIIAPYLVLAFVSVLLLGQRFYKKERRA